ncbi:DUF2339 domain-containing protein [Tunturiibacter gelidoferens]|uniref:Membrane protein n=3 Tax=Tunturiibacter TaxID=3154218 RepID=A0ACC5P5F4_9BACT|nr:DUF2339 domain-containing protein [Edaphobacter lichenicola]MBB5341919.1 putative membrane protein [Edaphobacter lichenicola]NYF53300.1 putative membrane protein [Edaphobacter lichenicola]
MASEDVQDDQNQDRPKQPNEQAQLAATLAALSARVESLEQQLAQLRSTPSFKARKLAAPPPRPSSTPSTEVPVPDFVCNLPKPNGSLEDRIGSQLFSRIGIVALLIATTLFLKWAIDNHWIGPTGRILAGLIAGAAIVVWSERFRRQGFNAFSYSLKAIGSGALYLSLWAAFQLYHLLPAGIALTAMILVTAWNAYMAWSQNSQILAAYALAGAFATPLLLSTGGNHEVFLFTYILAIDVATVSLVRLKPWPHLLFGIFPATVAFFIGWYVEWFDVYNTPKPLSTTAIFIGLFFLTFLLPSIRTQQNDQHPSSPITEILLPLANATFAALALYSVLQDTGNHDLLPWLAVLFAAFYLGLMRLPQSRITSAVHLSLAIVFLTIAIPLKASGRWIIVGWLAEGAALLWVAARLSSPTPVKDAASAPLILRRLATIALALGVCGLLIEPFWLNEQIDTAFFNLRFATALFGLAALGLSALIAHGSLRHSDQQNKAFPNWVTIAGSSIVAFNFIAILSCLRELDSAWRVSAGNPEADLQKALAISTFLMLYGACLLALGFWKRSAFIRWQALLLLVFTIGKAFLYDLRNLSQGYRVLSFLGLGALLMAISFAYQKDWLALRLPNPTPEPHLPPQEGADR